MAHAPPRRRGLARDNATRVFFMCALDVVGGSFLGVPANLSDHNHSLGLRIAVEQLERIQEMSADDRVTADAIAVDCSDSARASW